MTTARTGSTSAARRFGAAYVLSAFGFEFAVFVMTVLVYEATGSAAGVGALTAALLAPKILSPWYGSLVDRFPRHQVFSWAAFGVAAGLVLIAGSHDLPVRYATWLVVTTLTMLVANARTVIMTMIMPGRDHLHGNTVMLVALTSARLLAPLAGGLAASRWAPESLLRLAAAVYLAAGLLVIRPLPGPAPDGAPRGTRATVRHVRDGARILRSSPDLAYLATLAFLWRAFLGLQAALFIVYVKEALDRDSAGYGLFMTAVGLGSLAGSLAGPVLARWRAPGDLVAPGLALHYATFAALGLVCDFRLALVIAASSFAVLYATVVAIHSIRDGATPAEYRGRVYGCVTAANTPPGLASLLVGSWAAGALGVGRTLLAAGVLALVTLAVARRRFTGPRSRRRAG